jgi:hypothetical protein
VTRRFALIYYGLLVTVSVAVSVAVFSAGESARAERSVAGGYGIVEGADCLGTTVQLRQSGQFVTLERGGESLGRLRLRDGVLTGDVSCRGGRTSTSRLARRRGASPVISAAGRCAPSCAPTRPRLARDRPSRRMTSAGATSWCRVRTALAER